MHAFPPRRVAAAIDDLAFFRAERLVYAQPLSSAWGGAIGGFGTLSVAAVAAWRAAKVAGGVRCSSAQSPTTRSVR